MVVEFTASACTFCGGEVGTAPGQPRETAGHAAGGAGQGEEKRLLAAAHDSPAIAALRTGRVMDLWGS